MELRVLRYFLMTAREENIARAAELLHVTQPTLSRQLMQLEEELGVKLFHRGSHHIVLTEDGMRLKRRASEIVSLAERTLQEFSSTPQMLQGEISIGCGETANMTFLSQQMARFRQKHPQVRFNIHSATADDIREGMENGLFDLGLLLEPADISRHSFIRLPHREQWGVIVRDDSPLALLDHVTPKDLCQVPLIMAKRDSVRSELAGWFGDDYESLEIAATFNLLLNAVNMVQNGVGAALCFRLESPYAHIRYIPLAPRLETGAVLAWKKEQIASAAVSAFLADFSAYAASLSA